MTIEWWQGITINFIPVAIVPMFLFCRLWEHRNLHIVDDVKLYKFKLKIRENYWIKFEYCIKTFQKLMREKLLIILTKLFKKFIKQLLDILTLNSFVLRHFESTALKYWSSRFKALASLLHLVDHYYLSFIHLRCCNLLKRCKKFIWW